MKREALLELDQAKLVDEVVRALTRRLGETDRKKSNANMEDQAPVMSLSRRLRVSGSQRLLVSGDLKPEEERALSGMFQIVQSEEENGWDICLVTSLSPFQMADLALGRAGERQTAVLLQGLLEGKKIYLLERGLLHLNYRDTGSKPLLRIYQDYETAMYANGVRLIPDVVSLREEVFSVFGRRTTAGSGAVRTKESYVPLESARDFCEIAGPEVDFRGFRLLQESDLAKARVPGLSRVTIDAGTIVTPLAMDYITNHGLCLYRKE